MSELPESLSIYDEFEHPEVGLIEYRGASLYPDADIIAGEVTWEIVVEARITDTDASWISGGRRYKNKTYSREEFLALLEDAERVSDE